MTTKTATEWHVLHARCEMCWYAQSVLSAAAHKLETSVSDELWAALTDENSVLRWRETRESANDVYEFRLLDGRTLRVDGSWDSDGYCATGARFL